jgi:hypothetical protein
MPRSFSNADSKYKDRIFTRSGKRRLSKGLLLVLELRDDGYIVIRKTNPDTWYVNNKDVKND